MSFTRETLFLLHNIRYKFIKNYKIVSSDFNSCSYFLTRIIELHVSGAQYMFLNN